MTSVAEAPLLDVRGLTLHRGARKILDGVDLKIERSRSLALVGESGAGKSTIAMALMGLLDSDRVRIEGEARHTSEGDLVGADETVWARLRGRRFAMVFQDAASALNPCFTIGSQITSPLRRLMGLSRAEAKRRAIELLESVGLNDAPSRLSAYPHQLSGGMQQRVMIAIALACDPELLFADEPTSALDVTIQAQIVRLILDQTRARGASCVFVLHDLALASQACDTVVVLYAGQVMEAGPTEVLLRRPRHPYTKALAACVLEIETETLEAPTGGIPSFDRMPVGCRYADRCPRALPRCTDTRPPLADFDGRSLACWNPE